MSLLNLVEPNPDHLSLDAFLLEVARAPTRDIPSFLDLARDAFAATAITVGRIDTASCILYIEDNLANLSLVETILWERPGWRTIPALQGQIGVELARQHSPDIILLDLHLPDIKGEEVLRRLHANPRTASIPVVVISADATPDTTNRLLASGAVAFLHKSIDVQEFLDTLERLLPLGTPGDEPGTD